MQFLIYCLIFVFQLQEYGCPKPFKVWDFLRRVRKSLVASTLRELEQRGKHYNQFLVLSVFSSITFRNYLIVRILKDHLWPIVQKIQMHFMK